MEQHEVKCPHCGQPVVIIVTPPVLQPVYIPAPVPVQPYYPPPSYPWQPYITWCDNRTAGRISGGNYEATYG